MQVDVISSDCSAARQRGPPRHAARHEERTLPSAYFGTPVMLKRKSFHSLYFDKDCRTLATSKAKISQCIIAFLRNNPSVFMLLLMNSSGSMSTYCSQ